MAVVVFLRWWCRLEWFSDISRTDFLKGPFSFIEFFCIIISFVILYSLTHFFGCFVKLTDWHDAWIKKPRELCECVCVCCNIILDKYNLISVSSLWLWCWFQVRPLYFALSFGIFYHNQGRPHVIGPDLILNTEIDIIPCEWLRSVVSHLEQTDWQKRPTTETDK